MKDVEGLNDEPARLAAPQQQPGMSQQRSDDCSRTVSVAMMSMHQGMSLASRDQPAIDGKCGRAGQNEG